MTETVFNPRGLGSYVVNAVLGRDPSGGLVEAGDAGEEELHEIGSLDPGCVGIRVGDREPVDAVDEPGRDGIRVVAAEP